MCTWCPAPPGSPPPARCSPPPSCPACWATPPAESATLSTRYPPTAPGKVLLSVICGSLLDLAEDLLRLVCDGSLVRGRGDVGELLARLAELVLPVHRQRLGLAQFLGDPLDADILVEADVAVVRGARLFRPERRSPPHLQHTPSQ